MYPESFEKDHTGVAGHFHGGNQNDISKDFAVFSYDPCYWFLPIFLDLSHF